MDAVTQEIFGVIKRNIVSILPDLEGHAFDPSESLAQLGANSVDRVEVVTYSMEELGLSIPRHELQGIQNLQGLIDVFARHRTGH